MKTFTIINKTLNPPKILVRYMDTLQSSKWINVTEREYHAASLGSIGTVNRDKLELIKTIVL